MDRELERDPARLADPVAHAGREEEMVPVAGREVGARLRDPDDRPTRLELVERQPVVHRALEVEGRHVDVRGVVEPGTRAQSVDPRGSGSVRHQLILRCFEVGGAVEGGPRSAATPDCLNIPRVVRPSQPNQATALGRSERCFSGPLPLHQVSPFPSARRSAPPLRGLCVTCLPGAQEPGFSTTNELDRVELEQ